MKLSKVRVKTPLSEMKSRLPKDYNKYLQRLGDYCGEEDEVSFELCLSQKKLPHVEALSEDSEQDKQFIFEISLSREKLPGIEEFQEEEQQESEGFKISLSREELPDIFKFLGELKVSEEVL
jgi:hypothetical protein